MKRLPSSSKFTLSLATLSLVVVGCGPIVETDSTGGYSHTPGSGGAAPGTGGAYAPGTGAVGVGGHVVGTGGAGMGTGAYSATGAVGSGGTTVGGTGAVASGGAGVGGTTSGGGGTDGSGGASNPPPLRGVAVSDWPASATNCTDVNTLGVSWYYNWATTSECNVAAEYVPQVWGNWNALEHLESPAELQARGETVILGFNEPDRPEQSNLSVQEAISLWSSFHSTSLRIGSPATASDEAGKQYFEAFMSSAAANNLRVDFVAVHWYGWDPGSCDTVDWFEDYIEWAEQFGKPIWITEWSCRLQSESVVRAFYKAAIEMLKKHPLVERYAWFLPRSNGEFAGAALLDGNGNPTGFGSDFIAMP